MSWQQTVLTIIGGIITVIGSGVVAWLTSRASRHAADKTAEVGARVAEVQDRSADIDGMDRLVKNLESRLARVEQLLDKVESENVELETRIRTLEGKRARDRTIIRYLIDYARALIRELRAEGLAVPEPPAGIDLDDPLLIDY